jgi:hypothetical protein
MFGFRRWFFGGLGGRRIVARRRMYRRMLRRRMF